MDRLASGCRGRMARGNRSQLITQHLNDTKGLGQMAGPLRHSAQTLGEPMASRTARRPAESWPKAVISALNVTVCVALPRVTS